MKKLLLALMISCASSALAENQVLLCKPQELVTKATKTGLSTRLAAVKGAGSVAYINGKIATTEEAVRFAIDNMKAIAK